VRYVAPTATGMKTTFFRESRGVYSL